MKSKYRYTKGKDVTMHNVFPRNTRESRRIVSKTDSKEGNMFKRSLNFVGYKLWNVLPDDTIDLTDIYTSKARLKRVNRAYVDLLA